MFFIPFLAHSQDMVRYKVSYMFRYSDRLPLLFRETEMTLEIGDKQTAFYSRWYKIKEDIYDKYRGRDDEMTRELAKVPVRSLFWKSCYTNTPKDGEITEGVGNLSQLYYIEPLETPQWTLLDRDTTIMDYTCFAAECDFHGRHWTAFYTPDIPVSAGPWKLRGLPGLILYAEEADSIFRYDAFEVMNGDGSPLTKMRSVYKQCTKKEFYDIERMSLEDSDRYMRLMGYEPGEPIGIRKDQLKRKAIFLEKEYGAQEEKPSKTASKQ
ncbi:MAG: GLPGLI family protein [Prevotella sp.]